MDIGFYITNIDTYNMDIVLSSINDYITDHPYDNVVVFTNQMNRIFNDKFYVLHLSHAKYFYGLLFLFNIKDASIAATFPGPKKQILFTNEIYWQKNKKVLYSFWKKILLNSNMEIVVNNQENFDIYNLCWKKPLDIMPTFDKKGIENVISKI
jgi:hypothetical protein